MSLNKDSNAYVIGFTVIMVLAVALSLSFIATSLKPMKDKNVEVDTKTKILKSVVIVPESEEGETFSAENVEKMYNENITELVVNSAGEEIEPAEGESAFSIELRQQLKKDEADRHLPVFQYDDPETGETAYIIPLNGLGLWDEISGYLALKSDFNTIRGAAFDHKGETPGLGAEIAKNWFRSKFTDKPLFDDDEVYRLTVIKAGKKSDNELGTYEINGVSGATITSNGVDAMLEKCIALYQPFFEKHKTTN